MTTSLAAPPEVIVKPPTARQCLAWVVWDEARGESVKGRRAVLDAVHARMKERSKEACEVVAERKQFSGYKPFIFYYVDKKMLTMYEEAAKIRPVVHGCSYFHATYVRPKWATNLTRCAAIGKHIFYKEKKK